MSQQSSARHPGRPPNGEQHPAAEPHLALDTSSLQMPLRALEPFIIAIDGPGGTGKSSIARQVAKRFGLDVLDSGAVYRCVALKAQREGFTVKHLEKLLAGKLPEVRRDGWGVAGSKERLIEIARKLDIRFEYDLSADKQTVFLGDEVVSKDIRQEDISTLTSLIAQIPEVRTALIQKQIDLAGSRCVAEGRDMKKIFPNAQVKIFLEADLRETALRRVAQDSRIPVEQVDTNSPRFKKTLRLLEERNRRDSKQMSRSGYDRRIDTTGKPIQDSIERIAPFVQAALDSYCDPEL